MVSIRSALCAACLVTLPLTAACDAATEDAATEPTPKRGPAEAANHATSEAARGHTEEQSPPPDKALPAGTRVVGQVGHLGFREGRVTEVYTDAVVYNCGAYNKERQSWENCRVPRQRVWPLDGRKIMPLRVGQYAICNLSAFAWSACKVASIEGDKIKVTDFRQNPRGLSRGEVLRVGPGAEADIEVGFERERDIMDFDRRANAAGRPPGTIAEMSEGLHVLAWRSGASWHDAHIVRSKSETLPPNDAHPGFQVSFDHQPNWPPISINAVVPYPVKGVSVEKGEFIIIRPQRGRDWGIAQVEWVEDEVQWRDRVGLVGRSDPDDVVPLRRQ